MDGLELPEVNILSAALPANLTQRQYRRLLLDAINEYIRKANLTKVKRSRGLAPLAPTLNRKSLNRAVAIARRPGPYMEFEAGDLDHLLVASGYRPKA